MITFVFEDFNKIKRIIIGNPAFIDVTQAYVNAADEVTFKAGESGSTPALWIKLFRDVPDVNTKPIIEYCVPRVTLEQYVDAMKECAGHAAPVVDLLRFQSGPNLSASGHDPR